MDGPIILHVLCRTEHHSVSIGKLKSHKEQICSECSLPQDGGKRSQLLIFRFQSYSISHKEISVADVYLKCQLFCHLQGDQGAVVSRIGLVWRADQWEKNDHGPV